MHGNIFVFLEKTLFFELFNFTIMHAIYYIAANFWFFSNEINPENYL